MSATTWGSLLCRATPFLGADSYVVRLFLPGSVSHVLMLVCLICGSAGQLCLSKQGQGAEGRLASLYWGGEGSLGEGCWKASAFRVICILALPPVLACCWLSCCLGISVVSLLSDSGCPVWSLAEQHPRRRSPVTNVCVQTVIYPGQAWHRWQGKGD